MIGWVWKGAQLVYKSIKTVAWLAYTKPVAASLVGLATYTLTQRMRAKAREIGYVPVVTGIGRVFGFLADVFHYAIASGLAAAAIVSVFKRPLNWLYEALRKLLNPVFGTEAGFHGLAAG